MYYKLSQYGTWLKLPISTMSGSASRFSNSVILKKSTLQRRLGGERDARLLPKPRVAEYVNYKFTLDNIIVTNRELFSLPYERFC